MRETLPKNATIRKAKEWRSSRDNDEAAELLQCHGELSERELRQHAEKLVGEYWEEIEAVATALLEDTTLTGDEVEMVCDAVAEQKDWRQLLNELRRCRDG